jgi:hypothetical protein
MPGCNLESEAVHGLAAVLPLCTALRSLDLSYNLIGPDGAASLVQALTQLRLLNLYTNDLTEMTEELRDAISECRTDVNYPFTDSEGDAEDDADEEDA